VLPALGNIIQFSKAAGHRKINRVLVYSRHALEAMAPNDVAGRIEADEEYASSAAPNGVFGMCHNLDHYDAVCVEVSVNKDAATVVPAGIVVEPQGCHQERGPVKVDGIG